MRYLLYLLLISSVSTFASEPALDISSDVAEAVKTGNASSVAKYFASNVDFKILDKEDVYSKAQAELILKDFFAKHPIKSFSIIHKGSSKNGDLFSIGVYESTSGKKFRSYFLFKKEGTSLAIQQFRFENQDE